MKFPRFPVALDSRSPSAEDQWEWSKMELIPRGCPGGDGATCCPAGTFSVSFSSSPDFLEIYQLSNMCTVQ